MKIIITLQYWGTINCVQMNEYYWNKIISAK